jgi:hypothetical protein
MQLLRDISTCGATARVFAQPRPLAVIGRIEIPQRNSLRVQALQRVLKRAPHKRGSKAMLWSDEGTHKLIIVHFKRDAQQLNKKTD